MFTSYTLIPPSLALPASVVNTANSGFLLMTIQNAPLAATAPAGTTYYTMDDSVFRSELQVHNFAGNPYAPGAVNFFGYTNTADLSVNWHFQRSRGILPGNRGHQLQWPTGQRRPLPRPECARHAGHPEPHHEERSRLRRPG